jgi:hypothetical protein
MFRKLIYLVSFVLVLGLVGNVSADVQFTDATGDHLWSTPENWATGAIPQPVDNYVRIFVEPGPMILAGESFSCEGIHIGNTGEIAGALTLRGGTLEVTGGFNCGFKGPGTITMLEGTLTVGGTLKVARDSGASGLIDLRGGTISAPNFNMREKDINNEAKVIVGGGVLTLETDRTAAIQEYIDAGLITAYNRNGTLNMDYNVTNPGLTTLSATHKMNPVPANRSIVPPVDIELSWTLPDPCVPGQPVLVDVYITDSLDQLYDFTDPESMKVVSQQNVSSVVVPTVTKTKYYWAVDTYIGSDNDPVLGPVFSFVADNAPPRVNAGPDISTFLQDGTRSGLIRGTVTDDGTVQPFTVTWSVVEQPSDADSALPGAVIADPTAEQTMVTVFAEGTYVLQLEADDGEYTSSDTMMIIVHPDDWRQ